MALAPLNRSTKPIVSKGLFNPTGGGSYDDWVKTATKGQAMPSIAPGQVDDSVASRLTQYTTQDSPLMQAARTEGLKMANRRGLLNSSMASGAAMDAMIRAAVPLAQQDAGQDFQRNRDARSFEYNIATQDDQQDFLSGESALDRGLQRQLQARDIGSREKMQGRDIASREKLTLAQIASTEGLAKAQRELDLRMQKNQLTAAEQAQVRQIASTEGMAEAERRLQDIMQQRQIGSTQLMQQRQIGSTERLAGQERNLQERMQGRDIQSRERLTLAQIASTEGMAQADRALEERLAEAQLTAAEEAQVRDIRSREGLAGAERALQRQIQSREIQARTRLAAEDRSLQRQLQQREIGYQRAERQLDRNLQEKLSSWNLNSADRNAAAQFLTNMESMYQEYTRSIMANPNLSADQRTALLTSGKNLRDRQLDFVQQIYDVKLDWGQPRGTGGGSGGSGGGTGGGTGGTPSKPLTQGQMAGKINGAGYLNMRQKSVLQQFVNAANFSSESLANAIRTNPLFANGRDKLLADLGLAGTTRNNGGTAAPRATPNPGTAANNNGGIRARRSTPNPGTAGADPAVAADRAAIQRLRRRPG